MIVATTRCMPFRTLPVLLVHDHRLAEAARDGRRERTDPLPLVGIVEHPAHGVVPIRAAVDRADLREDIRQRHPPDGPPVRSRPRRRSHQQPARGHVVGSVIDDGVGPPVHRRWWTGTPRVASPSGSPVPRLRA